MPILPDKKVEQLQWCESHWPIFTTNATLIGLSAAQATTFKGLTQSARTAFDAAQNAKQAYHAAVTAQNAALTLATANAQDLIRVIKGFAELTSNPDPVYALAQIPPPAAPTPAQAPGKPSNFSIALQPDGSITLTWEATDSSASSGAFFNVTRKLPGQTAFSSLGGTSGSTSESRRMTFTDTSIPTSAAGAGAQYIVTGQRGTRIGEPSDAITVQFGTDGGTFTASNAGSNAFKIAA
jgi:hypothetical protein